MLHKWKHKLVPDTFTIDQKVINWRHYFHEFLELTHRIVFIGSDKLGFPGIATMAFRKGVDVISVAHNIRLA